VPAGGNTAGAPLLTNPPVLAAPEPTTAPVVAPEPTTAPAVAPEPTTAPEPVAPEPTTEPVLVLEPLWLLPEPLRSPDPAPVVADAASGPSPVDVAEGVELQAAKLVAASETHTSPQKLTPAFGPFPLCMGE
jgi:hypothetical protein